MPLCNNVKSLLGLPEIKKKNVPDLFYSKCHLNFQKTTFSNVDPALTLCVLVSPKCVLWQTVKTLMKWGISSKSTLFDNTKPIFRVRNTISFHRAS